MHKHLGTLLRVIFMLSTIVIGTDCCSSRILLLKEHTLKIVHDHGFFNSNENGMASLDPTQLNEHYHKHLHPRHPHRDKAELATTKNKTDDPSIELTITSPPSFSESSTEVVDATMLESSTEVFDAVGSSTNFGLDAEGTVPNGAGRFEDGSADVSSTSTTKSPFVQHINLGTFTPKRKTDEALMKLMLEILAYKCDEEYAKNFCLNKGRCFRFPLGNHSLYSCECPIDYIGERCESKNGQYKLSPTLESKPKILMARIVFSFPMLIALSALYIACGAVIVFKTPQNCIWNKRRAAGMLAG